MQEDYITKNTDFDMQRTELDIWRVTAVSDVVTWNNLDVFHDT